jgi:hypothetical protein
MVSSASVSMTQGISGTWINPSHIPNSISRKVVAENAAAARSRFRSRRSSASSSSNVRTLAGSRTV